MCRPTDSSLAPVAATSSARTPNDGWGVAPSASILGFLDLRTSTAGSLLKHAEIAKAPRRGEMPTSYRFDALPYGEAHTASAQSPSAAAGARRRCRVIAPTT